jgi:L-iditol 2-dehydrogenase
MQVAQLSSFHQFQMIDWPAPEPKADEVLIRLRAVGICGSDLHYFSEGAIGDTPCVYPMVLGHEPAGEVVKTGSAVSGISVGDRVMCEPAKYCYHCEYCMTGHHNVCANVEFLSSPEFPGFFREYVTLPVKNLLPVPEGMSYEHATMFEPISIIYHSMKFAQVAPGEDVVIFGAGPIGLLTVLLSKLRGARRVFVIEPLPQRREVAMSLGADVALPIEGAKQQIMADTGKRGADVVIDCASKDDTVNDSLDLCRPAGRVVITGVPTGVHIPFRFHTMRRKELYFYSVRRSNNEAHDGIELMKERPDIAAKLVTHTRPLDGIQGAFELLERYEDNVLKIVLKV